MTDYTPDTPPTTCAGHGAWVVRYRWGIIWTALLAIIVLVQWPMLKGMFYRASGSPAPDDGIAWHTDFEAALAQAKESGKPVLLDFTASWCPPCQVMKHEAWPDAKVRRAVTNGYIPVIVDVDNNARLTTRYGVSMIPAIVIVDATGQVLKRGSFMSATELLEFLTKQPA